MSKKPNIIYIMCDQFRFDCIEALGNSKIRTPNLNRLVERGVTFTNAYTNVPVCVAARYTERTGRDCYNTGSYRNGGLFPDKRLPENMEERCGEYLPRTLKKNGYRTFGIGKFHSRPFFEEMGYDVHLHVEEVWGNPEQRNGDAFAKYIKEEHPAFAYIEQLHGERTDMYYMPQISPLPAHLTAEAFVTDKTIEIIEKTPLDTPYFSFVSYVGPHPPCAPPIPYNRMYNPDYMDAPIKTDIGIDHMDEQLPYMNHYIWAEQINEFGAKHVKARYYGEISYIDEQIGRILDAVEKRGDGDNTLIAFFTDHGDHLGDHNAWQKESYFEQSAHIPFLVSLPSRLQAGTKNDELVSIVDLFGIATNAADCLEIRDGIDVLGMVEGKEEPREYLFHAFGRPGTKDFKFMARKGDYKYIFMANGDREQLFNIKTDPNESVLLNEKEKDILTELKNYGTKFCDRVGLDAALADKETLKVFEYTPIEKKRVHQFDQSAGITDFTITFGEGGDCDATY